MQSLEDMKAEFRARLATAIAAAKAARRKHVDEAIRIAPDRKAELERLYTEFCDDADRSLAEFDSQNLESTSEPWEVRRAQLVAECEEAKRAYWQELVRKAQAEPDLDITAEHDRLCVELDSVVADMDRAHALIQQATAKAKETMTNVAIALYRGDIDEAQRLMMAFHALRSTRLT